MLSALAIAAISALDGGGPLLPDGGVPFVAIPVTSGWIVDARSDSDAGISVVGGCWLDERTCLATGHRAKQFDARRQSTEPVAVSGGLLGGIVLGAGAFWLMWWLGVIPGGPKK